MFWLICAVGSAFFAGITAVLAKIGIEGVPSTLATAIRTVVVLGFAWLLVGITGATPGLTEIGQKGWIFLILSGLSTGASWLCYFKALQSGDVSRVAPIDKSSTVLTILLALIFLREPISGWGVLGILGICAGTLLMSFPSKAQTVENTGRSWLFYAIFSAVFASLTSILGKIGMQGINSNLGTAVRTTVVLVMAWGMVFLTKEQKYLPGISQKSWIFLILSGLTTGLSWLCYFKALQDGPASIVAPIDKLSILVSIGFSCLILKEKISRRSGIGLTLLTAGTLVLLL